MRQDRHGGLWRRVLPVALPALLILGLVWYAFSAPSAPPGETVSAPPEEPDGLTALRRAAEDAGARCAVAYAGYSEGDTPEELRAGVAGSGLSAQYPFVDAIPGDRLVSVGAGWDLYCIAPTDPGAQVTVRTIDFSQDWDPLPGETVYEGEGPILLWCNVSDIMPNALVTVTTGAEAVDFSPYLSLRDGSCATTAPQGTVYVFAGP